MWFGPPCYGFWLSRSKWLGWCQADVVGAALGVEGQAQCGLALKAKLGSQLNQVFVFFIGLYVFRGARRTKTAQFYRNSFNS